MSEQPQWTPEYVSGHFGVNWESAGQISDSHNAALLGSNQKLNRAMDEVRHLVKLNEERYTALLQAQTAIAALETLRGATSRDELTASYALAIIDDALAKVKERK